MSTIIRSGDARGGGALTPFNFDDLASQANRYLDQVKVEAAKIIADARQQASRETETARRRAEAEGAEAARRSALQSVEAMIAPTLPALRQAAEEIRLAKQTLLKRWENNAIRVALAIASRVIRGELARRPEIPLTLTREALELAAGSTTLRVQLHPGDHKVLAAQIGLLVKELSSATAVEIVADPNVAPGGCRVETDFGVIDQQIEAQLARIEEELVSPETTPVKAP